MAGRSPGVPDLFLFVVEVLFGSSEIQAFEKVSPEGEVFVDSLRRIAEALAQKNGVGIPTPLDKWGKR